MTTAQFLFVEISLYCLLWWFICAVDREVKTGSNLMTPKVCILNEDDARSLTYGGISHKCSSRRHHHYSKSKAEGLVKAGELMWIGKHKRIATFLNARTWIKTYTRNQYGEVLYASMQLVRGGGGF